jgi:MFS family permease
MISAGFFGQLVGALLFGWIAERYGRMTAMIWSIAVFAVMSLACAFAWDYGSLLVLRTIQGVGLGGEVPVAAVFISELAKAHGRGRFVLLYELVFPIGLVAASLLGLWVVPHLGWQYMFVIGALPALLALVLRSLLPESPRWLAVRGRHAEAEKAMSLIEAETQKAIGAPLPPVKPVVATLEKPASLADLFGAFYLRRTLVVWVIWFAAYFVNYGLSIWLPTLYRTVFKLPLDVSLRYGLITQAVGLLGTLICAPGRPAALVCILLRRGGARLGCACVHSRCQRGAGADLHDHRLLLYQHHQYRRLSLHARALSHPRARARGRNCDGLAAVCFDDRADRGRNDARRRPAVGVRHVRGGRSGRRRDHRRLRG